MARIESPSANKHAEKRSRGRMKEFPCFFCPAFTFKLRSNSTTLAPIYPFQASPASRSSTAPPNKLFQRATWRKREELCEARKQDEK
ncbi:hypothetical protein CBOM_07803 [Ceraceosorus bombacis]|uniref:Uncharacterized protein n=1 Tax=Ceraceosorus bombacis TaxID=401625 RepID=A0A0P1BPE9_9BASI|nr:hypothetical protein CBOM_07803 [Ceraceosorus bombacis]